MITPIVAEFLSTALMILFGVGVHCDTVLNGTKYHGSGHLFAITTWAFGISVCLFVFGGVCMNPAMALAQCLLGLVDWSMFVPYVIAEMAGGFAGAVISWFMYADAFRASEGKVDGVAIRNIFSTNPLINDRPAASSSRPSKPPSSSPPSSASATGAATASCSSPSASACSCGRSAWASAA